MPAVRGGGKLQQAILASLDGQPVAARDLIRRIVGGEPTPAQYNACHRTMRLLIARGQLRGWLEPSQHHPLILLKVGRWVGDHDGATASERQRAVDPLQQFVDEAWLAFSLDVGYASDIAMAARALDRFDADQAHGTEPGLPQVRPGSR
jgi:hypothetical protein